MTQLLSNLLKGLGALSALSKGNRLKPRRIFYRKLPTATFDDQLINVEGCEWANRMLSGFIKRCLETDRVRGIVIQCTSRYITVNGRKRLSHIDGIIINHHTGTKNSHASVDEYKRWLRRIMKRYSDDKIFIYHRKLVANLEFNDYMTLNDNCDWYVRGVEEINGLHLIRSREFKNAQNAVSWFAEKQPRVPIEICKEDTTEIIKCEEDVDYVMLALSLS